MSQIDQIVLDSNILPLSLYFEPEEIAAACISIANLIFNESVPKFMFVDYTKEIKKINSHGSEVKKTGTEIIMNTFNSDQLI